MSSPSNLKPVATGTGGEDRNTQPESDITPLARRGAAALVSSMEGGMSEGQQDIEGKIVAKIAAIVQPDRHSGSYMRSMQTKVSLRLRSYMCVLTG